MRDRLGLAAQALGEEADKLLARGAARSVGPGAHASNIIVSLPLSVITVAMTIVVTIATIVTIVINY